MNLTKEQKKILARCLRSGRYQRDSEVEVLSAGAEDRINAAWLRTLIEIRAALAGDPVARAENAKKVDLMRQREERDLEEDIRRAHEAEEPELIKRYYDEETS